MASTRKNGKIKDYKESIRDRIIDIQEKDIREAKELSKKTSPGFASMWTGVPKDVITGDANKVAEQKAADRAHMQKRSRELFDVDNGYLAKANKEYARKLHGFSEKEVRAILAFRTKENEKRVKINEPGIFTRAYEGLRNLLQPDKVEEEKIIKRQTTLEHREAMRKKYGLEK